MPQANLLDNYDQWALLLCPAAVAATGQVSRKLETGLTNRQTVGWVVSVIEFWVPVIWLNALSNTGNFLALGLAATGDTTAMSPKHPSCYHMRQLVEKSTPAATGDVLADLPFRTEFQPGHELLIVPQNVYMFVYWSTAVNLTAVDAECRIHYKEIELGTQNWYDLLQLRSPLGV